MAGERVKRTTLLVAVWLLMNVSIAWAQKQVPRHLDALQELDGSVQTLVNHVSDSVVQVLVTSYGPVDQSGRDDTDLVIGRQRSIGSGVIIDPDGYIVTNAHVVSNARRVQVVLSGAAVDDGPVRAHAKPRGRTVDARIVGVAREIDLALLKVDTGNLAALPIADYDALRQGELVFAFGSPEGLRDSVTMGIVSAVARQADPDSPLVYIQTDASSTAGTAGSTRQRPGRARGDQRVHHLRLRRQPGTRLRHSERSRQMAYPKLRNTGTSTAGDRILMQTITRRLQPGSVSRRPGARWCRTSIPRRPRQRPA